MNKVLSVNLGWQLEAYDDAQLADPADGLSSLSRRCKVVSAHMSVGD